MVAERRILRGIICGTMIILASLASARAEAPRKEIAVLFAGHPCGFEAAGRLQKDGMAVNVLPRPGLDKFPLTWEKVKDYNVIVLSGLGQSNADFTLSDINRQNIETLNRFMNEGGGVLFIPCWGQMNTGIPPQEAFAKPLGLTPLFPEVIFDPETSARATSWKIDFALTSDFAKDSPVFLPHRPASRPALRPAVRPADAPKRLQVPRTALLRCVESWVFLFKGG